MPLAMLLISFLLSWAVIRAVEETGLGVWRAGRRGGSRARSAVGRRIEQARLLPREHPVRWIVGAGTLGARTARGLWRRGRYTGRDFTRGWRRGWGEGRERFEKWRRDWHAAGAQAQDLYERRELERTGGGWPDPKDDLWGVRYAGGDQLTTVREETARALAGAERARGKDVQVIRRDNPNDEWALADQAASSDGAAGEPGASSSENPASGSGAGTNETSGDPAGDEINPMGGTPKMAEAVNLEQALAELKDLVALSENFASRSDGLSASLAQYELDPEVLGLLAQGMDGADTSKTVFRQAHDRLEQHLAVAEAQSSVGGAQAVANDPRFYES